MNSQQSINEDREQYRETVRSKFEKGLSHAIASFENNLSPSIEHAKVMIPNPSPEQAEFTPWHLGIVMGWQLLLIDHALNVLGERVLALETAQFTPKVTRGGGLKQPAPQFNGKKSKKVLKRKTKKKKRN